MSFDPALGSIIDQMRANLHAVGIQATESDLQGIAEKGFLQRVVAFEQLSTAQVSDTLPDYLASWEAPDQQPISDLALPHSSVAEQRVAAPSQQQLQFATIGEIAPLIRTRQVRPTELLEQLLTTISAEDSERHAFQLVLSERARAQATQAEQELASGTYRGPLHGIPIALKDLIALAGHPTTAGSRILADWVPTQHATAATLLEQAGAVIVGKARMSEFAYSPGSNNGHYGSTPNPFDDTRDAGGSSSGSAVAVATGSAYAALGSDTGGSIRIPAAFCGVVGLKPTFGRCSLHGVVPLAWSLDHLGPLTRSVGDAALLLNRLAGHDPQDARTRPNGGFALPNDLDAGVKGMRIGVLRSDGTQAPLATPEVLRAWHASLADLEAAGAELIAIDLPEFDALRIVCSAIMAQEAAAYHLPWLQTRLADYADFMRQRILAAFAYGPGALIRAQQLRASLRQRCSTLFASIDLLSTPTHPDRPPALGTPGLTSFTNPLNLLGWPAIAVPIGKDAGGLPMSIQLIAKPWGEARLLRAARAVELTR
jgi:aspartyl-tRNA(Asn)/glutamyl-tRNA(Gln) amidotransferase subunit A